ncbi:MAG: DUF4363 family protein [Ruminococcus sp.]|nr:DUF4363 family protein [Ruminococcus sp.]
MQRVKLCIVLLSLTFLASLSGMFFITYHCNELSGDITKARDAYYSGDKETALAIMETAVSEWNRDCRAFSCFVKGEKLMELNSSVSRLIPFMESDNDELSAEFMTTLSHLELMHEAEIPHIYNIF